MYIIGKNIFESSHQSPHAACRSKYMTTLIVRAEPAPRMYSPRSLLVTQMLPVFL